MGALLCRAPRGTRGDGGVGAGRGGGACNGARGGEEEGGDAWKDGIPPSGAPPPLSELHFLPPPAGKWKKSTVSPETIP